MGEGEADEIAREEISRGFPPFVRYTLTEASADMLKAWQSMVVWTDNHADLITRARQRRPHPV